MVKELEKGMAMFAHDECTVNYKIMSLTIKTHKSSSEIQSWGWLAASKA